MQRKLLVLLVFLTSTLLPTLGDAYGFSSAHGQGGPPRDGFVLAISSASASFRLGAPIAVTLELRNITQKNEKAMLTSLHSGYLFTIKNVHTGLLVPANPENTFGRFSGSVSRHGWDVPADSSLYAQIRLDLLYSFAEPGAYSVQVTRGSVGINGRSVNMKSNVLMVDIAP